MKTTNRILQILTALGAIASGVFYFANKSESNQIHSDTQRLGASLKLEQEKTRNLQDELRSQESQRETFQSELKKIASENALAQSQLLQLRRENQRLLDERETQQFTQQRLQQENGRLAHELASLKASSVSQDQVAQLEQDIARLERENLELKQTRIPVSTPIAILPATIPDNPTLKGSVLTVGKGTSFVVINIGYNDGVRLQNELFIHHADTPIAKIQVTEVKENLSIARIVPDSLLKTPQSGDSVASPN